MGKFITDGKSVIDITHVVAAIKTNHENMIFLDNGKIIPVTDFLYQKVISVLK